MKAILVMILLLTSCSSFSENATNLHDGVILPAKITEKISFAYSDFKNRSKDPECFDLYVQKDSEMLILGFFWSNQVSVKDDQISIGGPNQTQKCGSELVYKFSLDSGKFLGVETVNRK